MQYCSALKGSMLSSHKKMHFKTFLKIKITPGNMEKYLKWKCVFIFIQ